MTVTVEDDERVGGEGKEGREEILRLSWRSFDFNISGDSWEGVGEGDSATDLTLFLLRVKGGERMGDLESS